MYAMLMKKENLSNGGFCFNPVTVIEGELNRVVRKPLKRG